MPEITAGKKGTFPFLESRIGKKGNVPFSRSNREKGERPLFPDSDSDTDAESSIAIMLNPRVARKNEPRNLR